MTFCLNPSSSGLPILGSWHSARENRSQWVLIPLLVDYPFWAPLEWPVNQWQLSVLIPLLVDYPFWVLQNGFWRPFCNVLIPLLVDYPFWVALKQRPRIKIPGLNPSSSGLPILGWNYVILFWLWRFVLIPLLVDYPFWATFRKGLCEFHKRLNPSSSGLPILGIRNNPLYMDVAQS